MTRKQYETKMYLSRVKSLKNQIESQFLRIEELEAYVNKVTSLPATDKVTGGTDKIEIYNEKLAKLIDGKTKIMAKIDKLNSEIKEIEILIESIKDDRIKNILLFRYINCLTWEEIGKKTGITERQSRNLHLQGLTAIGEIINND